MSLLSLFSTEQFLRVLDIFLRVFLEHFVKVVKAISCVF